MGVPMRVSSLLCLLLLACSGDDGTTDDGRDPKDTDSPDAKEVTLDLVSPVAGTEYPAEDPLQLHVEAKRDGSPIAIESATWSIGGWTGTGKETEATGLASGPTTVSVEVVAGGETLTTSVDITIAEPVQTLFSYAGTLEANVVIATEDFGDFDDRCTAPITLTLDSGTLTGSGQCMVFEDFVDDPLQFRFEGTVRGGNVTGDLVMATDDGEARTPFSGTGSPGSALEASFDNTFRDGGDSVTIAGSWSATPQ